jgi:beta-glucosidase-like glycosyl hydrolase
MNPVNYGSTFNDSLAYDLGAVIGLEARALWLGGATEYNGNPSPKIGLDAWSPNVNIARDPREWSSAGRPSGAGPAVAHATGR